MNTRPVRGMVYSLAEINCLTLRDSEHLGITVNGVDSVVQNSHFMSEDLMNAEGWSDTRWQYVHETEEWIPVFKFVPTPECPDISVLLDIEPDKSGFDDDSLWCVPKAFPREQ